MCSGLSREIGMMNGAGFCEIEIGFMAIDSSDESRGKMRWSIRIVFVIEDRNDDDLSTWDSIHEISDISAKV